MNINTLFDIIELFNIEVVNSGFQRDIQDYINSLPSNQSNIIALNDIATKTYEKLELINNGDLPEKLKKLFTAKVEPFTNYSHISELKTLLDNREIQLPAFFQKLNQILTDLNTQIQQSNNEVKRIKTFIDPYITKEEIIQTTENKAIISIVFKDIKTTSNLKEFSKTIQLWNRVLPLYHQLLKSSSPEDIEIVTVQNGSIDFLFNIDFDIALDLTEVFKIGFQCFLAYLSYKKLAQPMVATYFGNKRLIQGEKEREKEMINNIGEAVKNKILEQHKAALETDNQIDKSSSDKKIEEIEKLVTSHILKGNDFKLLSLPELQEDDTKKEEKEELRKISTEVRQALKKMPQTELKILQEKYDMDMLKEQ